MYIYIYMNIIHIHTHRRQKLTLLHLFTNLFREEISPHKYSDNFLTKQICKKNAEELTFVFYVYKSIKRSKSMNQEFGYVRVLLACVCHSL